MGEWEERKKLGRESCERLKKRLQASRYIVEDIGSEKWLSPAFRKNIRYVHNNTTIDFIRYFPDLIIYKNGITKLVEVKATLPEHRAGDNFSIETACLENDKKLCGIGINVFIVFENYPNEFFGNRADLIKPFRSVSHELSKNYKGSGTPMSLIKKSSVPKLGPKKA